MFSSVVDLSIMDSLFTNVLYLKEVMINGHASSHVTKRLSRKREIGFRHKYVKKKAVSMRDLAKSSKLWSLSIFSQAYTLLLTEPDHTQQSEGTSFRASRQSKR
jgi:hypothetical protein